MKLGVRAMLLRNGLARGKLKNVGGKEKNVKKFCDVKNAKKSGL
jgi:hypothetical protein